MSYMTIGATGTGYTLYGKSDCRNDATGAHVATTKCAGQTISTSPPPTITAIDRPSAVVPATGGGPPLLLLGVGALALAGGAYWFLRKK